MTTAQYAGKATGQARGSKSDPGTRPVRRRRPVRRSHGPVGHSRGLAYLLLLPAFLSVIFLLAYPLYLVFTLALNERVGINFLQTREMNFGFANFEMVLTDNRTWHAVWNTVVYTAGSIIPAFLIGLALALLLNRQFPARRWIRSLIFLPWAVPGVIVSITFLWMLNTSFGVVNAQLRNLGIISGEIGWYTDPDVAMFSVILPTIWKGFPFFALTMLAALQAIPATLYEAARLDGATKFQLFRFVTWPGIRGPAVLVLILQTLWVMREFDIPFATTGGGPAGATETLGLLIYDEAFSYFRVGNAAALGVLLLLMALAIIVFARGPLRKEYF